MKHVYEGKTKSVYQLDDGNYLLKFKDDVTGTDGKFDPGANTVGLAIPGIGKIGLGLTDFFFRKIMEKEIPTHYISADLDAASMIVKPATPFGNGLEIICRFKAVGSFMRRYGMYAKEGQSLDAFCEITLKDDERNDPPISKEALSMLGVLTEEEYDTLIQLTKKISIIIKELLMEKDAELYDIKLEFGRDTNGQVMLIDEISGGNMRVYKDGSVMDPMDIPKLFADDHKSS